MKLTLALTLIFAAGCLSQLNKEKIDFYDKCICDCFRPTEELPTYRPWNYQYIPESNETEDESEETITL